MGKFGCEYVKESGVKFVGNLVGDILDRFVSESICYLAVFRRVTSYAGLTRKRDSAAMTLYYYQYLNFQKAVLANA